ncbi:hypothetical protein [Acinetobacter sp. YH12036]|uniref:hypothetical protein n=1 Tax=Acinetobacter sp. YH12036 TaxID=2601046 RepID=UPI0015D3CFA7|nr:hypothetical protein [Acinetobacter sp. YH12036]
MVDQAPDKPKRKRRTKAEMEAARVAGMEKPKAQGVNTQGFEGLVPVKKPPTQGVGVIGINDSVFGSDTSGVRWEVLIHMPKFQMFCIERSKLSYENVMDWIIDFAIAELNKDNCQFFKDYKEWHDTKGYWKNETIYGELIDG